MAASMQRSEGFSIDVLVAEFALDLTRSSLELPHLTTGQRKQVKRVVGEHPELTCESYGFGSERQLHLFKGSRSCAAVASSPEDAGVAKGGEIESQKPMLGSPEAGSDTYIKFGERDIDASADCSNEVASASCSTCSPESSPPLSVYREALSPGISPPFGFEVRNTFGHFDSPRIAERVVQSMPRDMFRQALWREAMEQSSQPPLGPFAGASAELAPLLTPHLALSPGADVVIDGLLKAPAFNGLTGTVRSFDAESGRYDILLTRAVGTHKFAKVKGDNLQLVQLPPAPRHVPSVSLEECHAASVCASDFVSTPTWDERHNCLAF